MTEKQKINADARAAFANGDYHLAFHKIWNQGIDYFVSFAEKEKCNWFTHTEAGKFFWEDFILNETIFDSIFNSDAADQILHNYFTRYNHQVQKFEEKLACKFPETFVKGIRVNQVFLQADRIENICSIQLDSKFKTHQKLWKILFEIEFDQWQKVEKELSSISTYSLNEVLIHCIIWLETIRFNNNDEVDIDHLAYVYSFFIELVMCKYPEKFNDILDENNFFIDFIKTSTTNFKDEKAINESKIAMLLTRISQWINYKENVICAYCFDLNIEPIQQNELIVFNSTAESYYKWRLNGVRYAVNQLNYNIRGNEFVEYQELNNLTKIPGKTQNDIELNRILAGTKWSSLLLLRDLACETFQIGNKRIESEKLLNPLLDFSFNKLIRYEQSLRIHSATSKSWNESFKKLTYQSIKTNIRLEPFILMTVNEYMTLNKAALPHIQDPSNEVVHLFSYSSHQKIEFNRYQQKYNVWEKPFVKIGNILFCPMIFFANNIWFYSFAQAALNQKTQRGETQKMEIHLGELIKQKGWEVKVITNEEAGDLQGDVDIFVEDKDTTLFIQLKRTFFRFDLKSAYFETINTDTKAAKQLNIAENYLEKPNWIYELKRKPSKWIVSTSFENIGNQIKGCFKVNYFELLNALNNPKIKKINELVDYVESDRYLKTFAASIFNTEIPIEIRQLVSETIKPLAIFESKSYNQVIFSEDENETKKYNLLYEEAIKLDKACKKNEALVQFRKCVSINPNDGDAYGAIANILADMNLFEASFLEFRKALEILPNDPFITKNYFLALLESGRYYEGLNVAIQLLEKLPLIREIKILLEKNFEIGIKNNFLTPSQLVEMQQKIKKLNM